MRRAARIAASAIFTAAMAGSFALLTAGASVADPNSKATGGVVAPKATAPMMTKKKKAPGIKGEAVKGLDSTVMELTVAECTKLGGRVDSSDATCTKAGQFTCRTVTHDSQGNPKANTACIDEVSQ